MNVEQHNFVHEFPEHREKIHNLKMQNAHFSKLFDEYHCVTKVLEDLEKRDVPIADSDFENQKKKRALLKDQLYAMLIP